MKEVTSHHVQGSPEHKNVPLTSVDRLTVGGAPYGEVCKRLALGVNQLARCQYL